MKNLIIKNQHGENVFILQEKMVKEIMIMVIFHIYTKYLKNVRNTFNFNTFIDFHNHYLKKDVLLLADAFEKFVSTSLETYNLDPSYYFSTPGLSWDAILKMAKVELEKVSNPDIHLFIEKGLRVGIS